MKKLINIFLLALSLPSVAADTEAFQHAEQMQQSASSRVEMQVIDNGHQLKLHHNFYSPKEGEFINVILVSDKKSPQNQEIIITTKQGQLIENNHLSHFFSFSPLTETSPEQHAGQSVHEFFQQLPIAAFIDHQFNEQFLSKGYSASECQLLENQINFTLQQYFVARRTGNDEAAETHRIELGWLMLDHSNNC